jgi:hypothetical protein
MRVRDRQGQVIQAIAMRAGGLLRQRGGLYKTAKQ